MPMRGCGQAPLFGNGQLVNLPSFLMQANLDKRFNADRFLYSRLAELLREVHAAEVGTAH